jgi:hypothetical protein
MARELQKKETEQNGGELKSARKEIRICDEQIVL